VDFIWGQRQGFSKAARFEPCSGGQLAKDQYPAAHQRRRFMSDLLRLQPHRSSATVTNWTLAGDANTSGPVALRLPHVPDDSHIIPRAGPMAAWRDKRHLRFWEFQSKDITGSTLVATNFPVAWVRNWTIQNLIPVSIPPTSCQHPVGAYPGPWVARSRRISSLVDKR